MKVLITGANGQLGRELTKQYKLQNDVELILTDYKELDITDLSKVYEFFDKYKPEVVVNCAAYTQVDKCETDVDNAYKVNTIGPRNLAQAANKIGCEIVQISTDYIFNGEANTPITEFCIPDPQTVYGKTKIDAELLVKTLNPKYYIFRTAWLYGDGNNFVKTMIDLSKNHDSLKVVNDQIGSPTSSVDLAKVIIDNVAVKNYGIFNCTCKGQCSWYDFTKKIFELKNISTQVVACSSDEFPRPAKRPHYSVLRNYMLELTTGDTTRNWEEAIKDYLENYDI